LLPEVDASTPDAGVFVDAGPTCGCMQWGNPRNGGPVADPLVELSGLVASRSQPGVFYAHNVTDDHVSG
jgi:hypothetical protein